MTHWVKAVVVGIAAIGLTAGALVPTGSGGQGRDAVVHIENGQLQGTRVGSVDQYLGIPFAASPTRGNRLAPPQPVANWDGVRPAATSSPACIQFGTASSPEEATSEDCLYLNVYAPAKRKSTTKLPVIDFIHGGGWVGGSAELYSGQQLADEQNVVVVVGQYRIGQLGYLALPEMGDAAGSLATLDQVAVLQWINRNIAQFGGDRTNVTVTGQSAGASSVCAMLTTPLAKNLFSRAIIQSGSCNQLTGTPIATATTNSDLFVAAIGCDAAADKLACLRSKGSIDFVRAAAATPSNRQATGTTVLPNVMATAIADGNWNKVPVMIGNTLTEGKLFMPPEQTGDMTDGEYESLVRQQYPAKADAVLNLYPASKFGGGFYALAQIASEGWLCSSMRMATTFSGQTKTFSYIFDDPTSPIYYGYTRPNTDMSNAHGTDLKYLYDLTIVEQDLDREQAETAKRIRAYWGAFAWSGDPGKAGRSPWPAVTPSKLSTKILGPQENVITDAFAQHNCEFWAQP